MIAIRRGLAVLLATLALIVAPAAATASAAAPSWFGSKRSYVALGDSMAAGVGASLPLDDCGRARLAYPKLIATATGLDLEFEACAGASLTRVAATQLEDLNAGTDYVTVQAGPNDLDYVGVLTACAGAGAESDAACSAKLQQALYQLQNGLAARAASVFSTIRSKAPRANLVVVGYPRLFKSTGALCSGVGGFTIPEQQAINQAVDLLNQALSAAAQAVGAEFANPTNAFAGHALCDRTPWILGVNSPAPFHANALGHALGLAPVVARKMF